jgi:hypothetical protein
MKDHNKYFIMSLLLATGGITGLYFDWSILGGGWLFLSGYYLHISINSYAKAGRTR